MCLSKANLFEFLFSQIKNCSASLISKFDTLALIEMNEITLRCILAASSERSGQMLWRKEKACHIMTARRWREPSRDDELNAFVHQPRCRKSLRFFFLFFMRPNMSNWQWQWNIHNLRMTEGLKIWTNDNQSHCYLRRNWRSNSTFFKWAGSNTTKHGFIWGIIPSIPIAAQLGQSWNINDEWLVKNTLTHSELKKLQRNVKIDDKWNKL